MVKQQPDHLRVPVHRSHVQRGLILGVCRINVGLALNEQPRRAHLVALHGRQQRRVPDPVDRLDVGPAAEQLGHGRLVTVSGSQYQPRLAVSVGRGRRRNLGQQRAQELQVAKLGRREKYRVEQGLWGAPIHHTFENNLPVASLKLLHQRVHALIGLLGRLDARGQRIPARSALSRRLHRQKRLVDPKSRAEPNLDRTQTAPSGAKRQIDTNTPPTSPARALLDGPARPPALWRAREGKPARKNIGKSS